VRKEEDSEWDFLRKNKKKEEIIKKIISNLLL
jgi:hypothetical protein